MIWLLLLAVATLMGCSGDSLGLTESTAEGGQDGPAPVSFSAYTTRSITRGGAIGTLSTAALKAPASKGFGVFAYYTNADDYASGAKADFMYNQQVTYDTEKGVFDYAPMRYWPNEHGLNAQSEDIDKVSFFAYAPYVEADPATGYLADPDRQNGGATWGITGTSRNTYTGDPLVRYIAAFEPAHSVDLCWGVYSEATGSGWAVVNGKQEVADGMPWLNVQRAQTADQRLMLTFRHATAQLNVQIDANFDGQSTAGAATKIYVRSVTFTGMAAQGALNLNNVKPGVPLWMNYTGTGSIVNGQSVTIHDGLRDGYEGTAGADATGEAICGLNPLVIGNPGNTTPGVTGTARNLFGRSDGTTGLGEGICVIPTGEPVRMTIVYDVETEVPRLSGLLSDGVKHGISQENSITTDLMYDNEALTFEGGKSYTLRLHLGMNSVKLDATVSSDWNEDGDIRVPERDITLSTITQQDIANNRGTPANPRAWVICEAGHLHLCQNGREVDPLSLVDDPVYLSSAVYSLSCGQEKVAMVCYVGEPGSVDKSAGSGGYRGLAIALEDAKEGDKERFAWSDSGSSSAICIYGYRTNDGTPISTTEEALLCGIGNTRQLTTGTCNGHQHDAARQVLRYSEWTSYAGPSHTAPDGASQWFLPTIGQWSLMVQGLTGNSQGLYYDSQYCDDYQTAAINKYIEAAAGVSSLYRISDYYWSSTECIMASYYPVWIMNFSKGSAEPLDKSTECHVRPAIAF